MNERPVGMILAAGIGSRLEPVTDHVPKPLLPVGGATLLDRAAGNLFAAGCSRLAVNTHHLPQMIRTHLDGCAYGDRVTVFHEPRILGTGGALRGAADFLRQAPWFLVHNGDVLCDADLGALLAAHRRSGAQATLLLVDWEPVNTVLVDAGGAVLSLAGLPALPQGTAGRRGMTYAGIAVFDRSFLDDIEPGVSSLVAPLQRAVGRRRGSVRGFIPDRVRWSDLGTVGRFLRAAGDDALPSELPELSELSELSRPAGPLNLEPIAGQGSDRRFWRLRAGDWSAVGMVCPSGDPDFPRYLAAARFLHEAGLGGPRILAVDEPQTALLMQDVGPRTLCSLVPAGDADPQRWLALYEPVVDRLLQLQQATDSARQACPSGVDRVLDADQLRWETGYFTERFLIGHLGLPAGDLEGLKEEFHALAAAVAAQPVVLIHRDFQSQNVVPGGREVYLVDVQGLRLGPLLYDAVSLLWDPYVAMPAAVRAALLVRFAAGAGRAPGRDLDFGAVEAMSTAAALQRLMQALGAFGYLSGVKGKRRYRDHIPRALVHLEMVLADLERLGREAPPDRARWLPRPMPALTRLVRAAAARRPAEDS